jgi:opacity protein-like surface antigen
MLLYMQDCWFQGESKMLYRRILVSAFLGAIFLSIATLPAFSQTAIVVSAYGAFNRTATGDWYSTQQLPANQAGGLVEFQHLSGPFFGFEATYSWNRVNTTYSHRFPGSKVLGYIPPLGCPEALGCPTETVSANAHEFTVDWNPSRLIFNEQLLLFGVLGGGMLAEVPSSNKATVVTVYPCGLPVDGVYCQQPEPPATVTTSSGTSSSFKPVYVYGAGLDWGLLPRIGLRVQYRGTFYSAPNMTKLFSPTGTYTHTAEPMVGIYFVLGPKGGSAILPSTSGRGSQ